jgi:hypothetical protein
MWYYHDYIYLYRQFNLLRNINNLIPFKWRERYIHRIMGNYIERKKAKALEAVRSS